MHRPRNLQSLLLVQARAFEPRVFGCNQPYRHLVKIPTHMPLVAKALTKTAAHEEFGKARDDSARNINSAARAGGQHVIAGHPTEPCTKLFQHLDSIVI